MTLLCVILIHESGHVIIALLCGVDVSAVRVRGGGVRIRFAGGERISYGREILICSGGVIFNLLTAVMPYTGSLFQSYSVGAAVFNLFPIRGSDGDGIVSAALSLMIRSPNTAETVRGVVREGALYVMWCAAIVLNLCGEGSLPLLVAVMTVFAERIADVGGD